MYQNLISEWAALKTHKLNLRGLSPKGREEKWEKMGREGPVKSAKPRARKGLYGVYAPDVKSTKTELERVGITCKFSITRKRKTGKEKRTRTA